METYPLSLAIFDFVPVTFFLIGAFFLVRTAVLLRGTACSRMVMAGSLLIFLGGFLKAGWKILYTTNAGDFQWMSQIQFVLVAPGFLALLIAAILVARGRKAAETASAVKSAPLLAMAAWKIPLLAVMTLASMGAQGILAYLSFRRGARLAAAGFIVAFLCLVGMGAMASGEQTLAKQWIEESINTAGQLGFMLGSILLFRNIKNSPQPC
jgi:hypothetical protein